VGAGAELLIDLGFAVDAEEVHSDLRTLVILWTMMP
jgi:hypothetical protein